MLVILVELKDIPLPDSMMRAMARKAEAEREKRAKIIAAEGEALAADKLGVAADIMLSHPLRFEPPKSGHSRVPRILWAVHHASLDPRWYAVRVEITHLRRRFCRTGRSRRFAG